MRKSTAFVALKCALICLTACGNQGKSSSTASTDITLGETLYPVYPSWKLTMQNPNDNLPYVGYVNALTGEFDGGR